MVTREEFIDSYIERSGHPDVIERLRSGIKVGDRVLLALPCSCGKCEGWAMISDDPGVLADHFETERWRGENGQSVLYTVNV